MLWEHLIAVIATALDPWLAEVCIPALSLVAPLSAPVKEAGDGRRLCICSKNFLPMRYPGILVILVFMCYMVLREGCTVVRKLPWNSRSIWKSESILVHQKESRATEERMKLIVQLSAVWRNISLGKPGKVSMSTEPRGQGQHYHLQFCHQRLRKTWAMAKCPVAHGAAEGLWPICRRDHLQLYHQLLVDSLNVSSLTSLPCSLKLNSAKQFRSLSSMHALGNMFLDFSCGHAEVPVKKVAVGCKLHTYCQCFRQGIKPLWSVLIRPSAHMKTLGLHVKTITHVE